MRDRRRTIIAALAGGVAVASAAFAVGSQAGDGSATADDRRGDRGAVERAFVAAPPPGRDVIFERRRGGPGVRFAPHGDLARRLGVSERRLHEALHAIRPSGDPRDALAESLAKSLDVDAGRVRDALEAFHRQQHDAFAERLAKELGIDPGKVKDALPPPPGP
ncbi:MAG TPA: hypothetical protein VGW75_05945 [Solirubrobacteraceae bacterium]|jgi:hypothetical protein|nr:hypothetical protein [Solirubrobacteraceae bacterium]